MDWYNKPINYHNLRRKLETPIVQIGDVPVLNVQWIDKNTLTVVIPSELPPGKFDIWVTNPGGQEAILVGGLELGELVYLPGIIR